MSNTISDSEIINKVISALDTNANKLSSELNYSSHMSIYLIVKGTNKISKGLKERLIMKFPQVNYNYLSTGEGAVLLNDNEMQAQMNMFNIPGKDTTLSSFLNGFGNTPEQLNRIESKLDKLIDKLGIEKD
jgi:hypothetical protein